VAAAGERDQRRNGDGTETNELNAPQHARHNARCFVKDRSTMFTRAAHSRALTVMEISMSTTEKPAMPSHLDTPKSDTRGAVPDQHRDQRDDREENAANYRRKIEELNRSRDTDIERALLLHARP
jgi:hypothetical protein